MCIFCVSCTAWFYMVRFLAYYKFLYFLPPLFTILYLLHFFLHTFAPKLIIWVKEQAEAFGQFLGVITAYLESLCSNFQSHIITNVQSNNDKVGKLLTFHVSASKVQFLFKLYFNSFHIWLLKIFDYGFRYHFSLKTVLLIHSLTRIDHSLRYSILLFFIFFYSCVFILSYSELSFDKLHFLCSYYFLPEITFFCIW